MRSRWLPWIALSLVEIALFVPLLESAAAHAFARFHWQSILRGQAPPFNAGPLPGTTAQGYNPGSLYWALFYDCREADVEVTGTLPRCLYWSAIPYGWLTLPLDSYVFDETVVTDDAGRYALRLTTEPVGRPNEINVSQSPTGMLLIRVTFAEDPESVRTLPPRLRVLEDRGANTE